LNASLFELFLALFLSRFLFLLLSNSFHDFLLISHSSLELSLSLLSLLFLLGCLGFFFSFESLKLRLFLANLLLSLRHALPTLPLLFINLLLAHLFLDEPVNLSLLFLFVIYLLLQVFFLLLFFLFASIFFKLLIVVVLICRRLGFSIDSAKLSVV
jgi:hypothetical protein